LTEACGARRATIIAHPDDAALLERAGDGLGLAEAVRLVSDPTRARGCLRVETDVGVLDADLAPQLDRLALRLRETLSR
jgi:flagellar biosynthesis/type III secretory pathway protein FliH